MNFDIPMKDEEQIQREAAEALDRMLAKRRGNRVPIEKPTEEDPDILRAKQDALRSIAGEPDYSDLDLGEQYEEDIVAPDLAESATGEPVMEDDKLMKLEAIKRMLEKQR
jgi:hypothetical protein